MLRKQKTVSFNHEELDYSKGTWKEVKSRKKKQENLPAAKNTNVIPLTFTHAVL